MCKFHCAARYTISLHYSVINISTNKLCITYVDLRFNWVSFRANICLSLEQHRKSELMLKLMLEIEKIKLLGLINCLTMFRRIISPINLHGVIYQFLDWLQHDTTTTNIKLPCFSDGRAECAQSHAIQFKAIAYTIQRQGYVS